MGLDISITDDSQHWESVHVCPECGRALNLTDIDLKTITTGIVECPFCDWSGPIEIQIVDVGGGSLEK